MLAVPVLPAVVRVRVPAVREGGAVHLMITRNSCGLAVLVAGTANWAVTTLHLFGVIAPHIDWVVQKIAFTCEVSTLASEAVPVLSTVEWISIVSILLVRTVHDVTTVCCWRRWW